MFRRLVPRLLGASLLAAGFALPAAGAGAELRATEGESKPFFVLTDLSGKPFDLSRQRGRIIVVHFFATWCEPCREELPALQRLAERVRDHARIIAISVAEPDLRVRRFAETTPVNFPILLDRDRAVARSWRIVSLPTTYVLDRALKASFVVEGDFAWDGLDGAKLVQHLADGDGSSLSANQ